MRALVVLILVALFAVPVAEAGEGSPKGGLGSARVKSAELRTSPGGLRLVLKTRNVLVGRNDDVFVYPKVFTDVSEWVYARHRHGRTWVVPHKSRRGRRFIAFLVDQLAADGSAVFKTGGLTDDRRGGRLNLFRLRGLDRVAKSEPLPGL